jgi:hypothetical protein
MIGVIGDPVEQEASLLDLIRLAAADLIGQRDDLVGHFHVGNIAPQGLGEQAAMGIGERRCPRRLYRK